MLDAAQAIDHGAVNSSPERQLWLSVIRQALVDSIGTDPRHRDDARRFLQGDGLLMAMDLAGLDRDLVPTIRNWKPDAIKVWLQACRAAGEAIPDPHLPKIKAV